MKIFLFGKKSAAVCKIPDKYINSYCFTKINNGVYKTYSHGLTRMDVYYNGRYHHSEEIFVFPENGRIPHKTHGIDYDQDTILAEILEMKMVRRQEKWSRMKPYYTAAVSAGRAIWPFLGIIITVFIVGGALIAQGGLQL